MAPTNRGQVMHEESDSDGELVMADADEGREAPDVMDEDQEESSGVESDGEGSELRRQEALEHMTRIEKEFAELKDRLYQEKVTGLKKEIEQISGGVHPEFTENMHVLEKKRNEKLKIADLWRDYQQETIQNTHSVEKESVEAEYQNERQNVRERMIAALQEKQKRLEEEKNLLDITSELSSDFHNRPIPTRKLRRRGLEQVDTKVTKKKISTGPQLVYTLKEAEILEDLYLIRRGSSGSTRRGAPARVVQSMNTSDKDVYDVRFDGGVLYYEKQPMERGSVVLIEGKDGRYSATITAINNSEVWVRKTDGSKTKLYISQLKLGKYTLRLKSS